MSSLYLSKWDAEESVYVSSAIVSNLKNYHIAGIRFLYSCYKNKLKGAILNHDEDMNFPLQLSAFLTALDKTITIETPVLIICSELRSLFWIYHLRVYGNFKVQECTGNSEEYEIEEKIIITTFTHIKLLQNLTSTEFSFIVIEDLDKVSNKTILKQLQGKFRIGLSTRNFFKHPDQKILFEMINWSNPGIVGKYANFCREYFENLQTLRFPYDKYWQRLTWKFSEDYVKPTDSEKKEYLEKMQLWAKIENITLTLIKRTRKAAPRKRKIKNNNKESKSALREDVCLTDDDKFDDSLSESDELKMKQKRDKGKTSKYLEKYSQVDSLSRTMNKDIIKTDSDDVVNYTDNSKNLNALLSENSTNYLKENESSCSNDLNRVENRNTHSSIVSRTKYCLNNSDKESLNNKEHLSEILNIKRKHVLPLLSSSEESYSDEDNSVLTSIMESTKYNSEKTQETEDVTLISKSQTREKLRLILDQSVEEFEQSFNCSNDSDSYDVLLSIMGDNPSPSNH